ncbi:MAG: hypothetical protein R2862_02800 [Thermoanaerobaculia bacterium]
MDQNRRDPWTFLGRLTLGALVACIFPAFGVAQEAPAMNHTEAKPVLTNPEAFDASDRDADGVVSWEEYRNAITKIFFEGDSDGDGALAGDELKIIRPNRMAFVDTSKDGQGATRRVHLGGDPGLRHGRRQR